MRYLAFSLILITAGCGSSGKKKEGAIPENMRVYEQREYAPAFPFEEFFKTAGLSNLVLSSDGETVFALKSDGRTNQIFSYQMKDKKWEQITQFPEPVNYFYVSKNGQTIVFSKDIGGSEIYDLYLMKLIDRSVVQITDGKGSEVSMACGISDDGNDIYFNQSKNKRQERDIRVYNQPTNSVRVLLPSKGRTFYCDQYDEFQKKLSVLEFIENNEIHIGLVDLRNNSFQYLIKEKSVKNSNSAFVNGAMHFTSTKDSDANRVWTYNFKTKKVDINLSFQGFSVHNLKSYQNGKYLAVKYREGMFNRFALFDSKLKAIPAKNFQEKDIEEMIFGQGSIDTHITLVASSDRPTQYYIEDGGLKELIYNSNQSRINEKYFATSYSTMVTSFDGTPISAHFFIPNGSSKKNRRPLLLWVHGGPEDHVDAEYSARIQFLVNNGFVVVAPNVRGSTGFGKKFQMMDNGDWGGGHIKDLLAVTNYAKTLDFVDDNNLFIVGGSFGGFSVMSMITQHATVYRAAVNIFGPIEFASFIQSWPASVQPYWLSELGKDPRTDQAFNQKVSPVYHLDQIQTPLQVHQGSNDIRVPKAQSDLLVQKMQERKIPVEYSVYPDEGHGFTKFENSKKCYEGIVDFLKKRMD
ncbi:MAG: S9 family peptidase [Pseudobdellovibrionaceae bacterium]